MRPCAVERSELQLRSDCIQMHAPRAQPRLEFQFSRRQQTPVTTAANKTTKQFRFHYADPCPSSTLINPNIRDPSDTTTISFGKCLSIWLKSTMNGMIDTPPTSRDIFTALLLVATWRTCLPWCLRTIVYKQSLVTDDGDIFGRPFVKSFALCYRTVSSPVLSVALV